MRIGLTAYVVMGNDFPDGVYLTKRGADRAIADAKHNEAILRGREPWNARAQGPGVYYRHYEFPIGPQLWIPSLAELAWRRRMKF